MQEPPVYVKVQIMVRWNHGMRCAEGCWALKVLEYSDGEIAQAQCTARFNPRKPIHKLRIDAHHRPVRCPACVRAMIPG